MTTLFLYGLAVNPAGKVALCVGKHEEQPGNSGRKTTEHTWCGPTYPSTKAGEQDVSELNRRWMGKLAPEHAQVKWEKVKKPLNPTS